MDNRYGFIREKIDIKILTLFILSRCDSPVDFDRLAEMALCDDGISYFDYAECLDDLVHSGHVVLDDGLYSITEKGISNGQVTETDLPFSVRMKALDIVSEYNAEEARNAKIVVSIEKNNDSGFFVNMKMSDGVVEVISMKLYADTEIQAKMLSDGFKARAEKAYNVLLSELTK